MRPQCPAQECHNTDIEDGQQRPQHDTIASALSPHKQSSLAVVRLFRAVLLRLCHRCNPFQTGCRRQRKRYFGCIRVQFWVDPMDGLKKGSSEC